MSSLRHKGSLLLLLLLSPQTKCLLRTSCIAIRVCFACIRVCLRACDRILLSAFIPHNAFKWLLNVWLCRLWWRRWTGWGWSWTFPTLPGTPPRPRCSTPRRRLFLATRRPSPCAATDATCRTDCCWIWWGNTRERLVQVHPSEPEPCLAFHVYTWKECVMAGGATMIDNVYNNQWQST